MFHRAAIASILSGLLCGPALAMTGVLDFSGNICGEDTDQACSNYARIGQGYGDIAGQLDVSHRSFIAVSGDTYQPYLKFWDAGYSDLRGVAWGGANPSGYGSEISFAPGPGLRVTLDSFDFGDYSDRSYGSQATVHDLLTGDLLWDSGSFDPGPQALGFAPAVGSAGGLILRWGPDGYDVGIDNIQFTLAPVPEPATSLLWAAGLGVMGLLARRRGGREAPGSAG
jgi:hypothetical protein